MSMLSSPHYTLSPLLVQGETAIGENWEMVEYKVDHLIAQGERVAMLGKCAWKSRQTGAVVETAKADFFHFREGKIVEFWEFYDTAKAIAGQFFTLYATGQSI
jgi:ketosteroid isomerase-like protein